MEGVGNEVLFTFAGAVAGFICIFAYYFFRPWEEEEIDIDENHPPIFNDNTCPICLNPQSLPLQTNCGHLYCGVCFKTLYEQSLDYRNEGIDCPLCRQRVSILFRCYTPEEISLAWPNIATRQEITAFSHRYNRMMSNSLTFLERISEIPVLLRHAFAELLGGADAGWVFRLRFFLYLLTSLIYFIVPHDFIPEIQHGLNGYYDDAIICFLLVYFLCRYYRNILAGDN